MTVNYLQDFNHGTPGGDITLANTPGLSSVSSFSGVGGYVRFYSPSWDGSVCAQLHTQNSSGSSTIGYITGMSAAASGIVSAKMRATTLGTGGSGQTSFGITLWDAGGTSATWTQINAGYGSVGSSRIMRIVGPGDLTWVTLGPNDGAWSEVEFSWGESGVDWQFGPYSGSYPYSAGPPVTLDVSCTVSGNVGNDLYIDDVQLAVPSITGQVGDTRRIFVAPRR